MHNGSLPGAPAPPAWSGWLSLMVLSRDLFILQTVFKEPALGSNYHFLRAFVFEFVYLGFDQNCLLPLLVVCAVFGAGPCSPVGLTVLPRGAGLCSPVGLTVLPRGAGGSPPCSLPPPGPGPTRCLAGRQVTPGLVSKLHSFQTATLSFSLCFATDP